MALRLRFIARDRQSEEAFGSIEESIAAAATGAMRELGQEVQTAGRADIAAAGFSAKWQNALRSEAFPKGGKTSLGAAAFVFHKIRYANVFEEGATIRGRPLLWLALPTAPQRIGRQKMTPQLFERRVGPLQYVRRPGGAPLLVADQASSRAKGRTTLSSLRRGALGSGVTRSVPVFVGVKQVEIRKKFHIRQIIEAGRARLPALFTRFLGKER